MSFIESNMTSPDCGLKPLPLSARLFVYGLHGVVAEVIFTAFFALLVQREPNRCLKGYSSIVSLVQFSSCALVLEQLYVLLLEPAAFNLLSRVVTYTSLAYSWELITGLIFELFGVRGWNYSHYKFNFLGIITLEYLPFWVLLVLYHDYLLQFMLRIRY